LQTGSFFSIFLIKYNFIFRATFTQTYLSVKPNPAVFTEIAYLSTLSNKKTGKRKRKICWGKIKVDIFDNKFDFL